MNTIKKFFTTEVLGHPLILAAMGAVAVIAAGSSLYYVIAARAPSSTWATASLGSIGEVVTGNGSVEPAQNPDLAFQSGGRVAAVNVSVGSSVGAGQTLASLDTASLSATLAQAHANLAGAQAQLDGMQAGPRATDVSAKQTAVSAAQLALSNLYADVSSNITGAYLGTYAGVRSETDNLFSNPNLQNTTLLFQTSDSQAAANTLTARATLKGALSAWQTQAAALSDTSAPADLDAGLTYSLSQLSTAQAYNTYLLEALADAVPSTNFSQAQLTAAQSAVGTLNTTVNGLISSLQQEQQQISSAKLAVQSAQDALNQILAGSTSQDIEAQQAAVAAAQAGVESAQAALSDALVVAPFAGTISSVDVKAGQVVAPNTVAVSLQPYSALQVEILVSEVDAAKLKAGQDAQVTLDAYGGGRIFPATISSVDTAPQTAGGYKVTLQFAASDPAITTGMGANVTIMAAQKDQVVVIPLSAVIQSGSQTFVLTPSPSGPTERPVVLGIEGTSTVEIVSGLSAGDQYLITAH